MDVFANCRLSLPLGVLVACFVLSRAAPGPAPIVPGEDWDEIKNIMWKLDSIVNHEADALGRVEVTLQFLEDDSRLGGTAGCNRYFGNYRRADEKTLEMGPFGSTMMACPEDVMDLERLYLQELEKVGRYRLTSAGDLELLNESGDPVLVFVRSEP